MELTDEDGGVVAHGTPCQWLALAECGCGPSDTNTFGLPASTGPCTSEGGCPLTCKDSGGEQAQNLCHSFPDGIELWEDQNGLSMNMFRKNILGKEYELNIYVKG